MNADFNTPQRQSAVGIVIMAADTTQKLIRAFFFPIILLFVKSETHTLIYVGIAIALFFIGIVVFAYLSYRNFIFYLDEEQQAFIVHHGVFNKTQLSVQLNNIQQVSISQNFLQKIIGIYGLKIDTPGTEKQEISIKAIEEGLANQLKQRLLNSQQFNSSSFAQTITEDTPTAMLQISAATLFKVGLTSNYGSSLAVLIGFSYAVFHNIKEFLKIFSKDENQLENLVTKSLTLLSFGLLVAALLIILLIINLLRTWIKYYQFNVSKHQDSLMISAGLLAKKHTLLKPSKVQITSYSQNYFQKKLAIFNLNLKQAHSGKAQNEHDSQQDNLAMPGCSPDEKAHLLRIILGQLPVAEQTFKPNIRFLNLPLFFKLALPIGIYLWCWFTFKEVQPYYPLAILYAVLAVPMIYISYCRHRLSVSQDFIIKKSGIWDISNEIILPHKIQAITTFQYPWHKAVDVGHVNLHTAAGVIHFKYGNYTEIKQLVNYWLYQIESGDENWM